MAVKKIKDAVEDKEQGKLLLRELKLLRHFRGHENVVRFLLLLLYYSRA